LAQTIVVRLHVEVEGKTLAQMEAELMGQLREQLGPAVGAEVRSVATGMGAGVCAGCGGPRRRRGREPRKVVGLFGDVEFERDRTDCRGCGSRAYPADEALGLEPKERYSLGVVEKALFLATDSSYAKSEAGMKELLRVNISHGEIHRLAQKEGQLLHDTFEGLRERIFERGERAELERLEAAAPDKDLVIIQADGTYVRDRGSRDRMEAKAGIVYSRKVCISKGRNQLVDKQTYGGVETMKAFGEKLALLAAQQGAFKAKQLWFVSDGDLALRQLRKDYFPTAIYFLDIWHLQDRLAGAMGDEVAAAELGGLMTLALNGKVDQIIERLAALWADQGDDDLRRGLLGDVITYIDSNREGITVYAKYGAQASGAIEKTMDVTVGRRLKAKGTSWHRPGAHRLLGLRVLKQNDRWHRYWEARRSRTPLTQVFAA